MRSGNLTKAGFEIVFGLTLAKLWPGMTVGQARSLLLDYIDAPFGDARHSWTAADAVNLAKEYATEFGDGGSNA